MLNYLKCMFQLILSPKRGWEDVSYEGRSRQEIAVAGFYPMVLIVSLSCFFTLLYDPEATVSMLIIKAIIMFIRFFAGYFISLFIISLMLPDYIEGKVNVKRTHTYILYNLGLLSIIALLANLLPFDIGITDFLPIYVAIIMWKGCRYMAVKPEKTGNFMLLAIVSIIMPPYLLGWLFDILVWGI